MRTMTCSSVLFSNRVNVNGLANIAEQGVVGEGARASVATPPTGAWCSQNPADPTREVPAVLDRRLGTDEVN
jgi:hypothetical protein